MGIRWPEQIIIFNLKHKSDRCNYAFNFMDWDNCCEQVIKVYWTVVKWKHNIRSFVVHLIH